MADLIQFDPNTGRKLNAGETVTYKGQTFTQGMPVPSAPSTSSTVNNTPTNSQPSTSFALQGGNLAVGSSGSNVSQLQQTLNAQGANLVVDGKFGPKTQAAVVQYQTQNGLKPDGIVGPLTTAKLGGSSQPIQNSSPTTPTTPSGQLGLLGAIADVATNTYSTKNSGLTLDEALKAAQNDPNIVAKYSDMLKLDTQGFQQSLQQLQQQVSTQTQQQQTQFENDRRDLSEKYAAAGQAYSGFRQRAQQQLGESQSGIVQSSRSAIQKSLNDLTSAFEGKYGSGASSAATAQFRDPLASSSVSLSGQKATGTPVLSSLSGQSAGGITGTAPLQQKQDVLNKGASLYQVGQLPQM